MSKENPSNIAHSVHQRLMNLAKAKGDDPNVLLMRYAIERLLYRITQSEYSSQFVLKGAILFTIWMKDSYRPTRDLDLLGYGDNSPERFLRHKDVVGKLSI